MSMVSEHDSSHKRTSAKGQGKMQHYTCGVIYVYDMKGMHRRPSFKTAVVLAVAAALHLCQSPCLFLLSGQLWGVIPGCGV